MLSLVTLEQLLQINDQGYIGPGHYAVINNRKFEFIKGMLNSNPRNFQHPLYRTNLNVTATYVIQDYTTGRVYVGSSGEIYKRIIMHKFLIKSKNHDNSNFNTLIQIKTLFDFELIVIFTNTRDEAYDLEQLLVNRYSSTGLLINIVNDVRYAMKGHVFSEEHKKKISMSNTGWVFSEEHKQNISASRKTSDLAIKQFDAIHERKKRRVSVYGIEYDGIVDAVKATGKSLSFLLRELKRNPKEVFYIGTNAGPLSGTKRTVEQNKKLSEFRKTDPKSIAQLESIRELSRKKIILNGVLYSSIQEAVQKTGIAESSIHKQLKRFNGKSGDIYVLNFQEYSKNKPKQVTINGIEYPSVTEAAKSIGIERDKLRWRIQKEGSVLTL